MFTATKLARHKTPATIPSFALWLQRGRQAGLQRPGAVARCARIINAMPPNAAVASHTFRQAFNGGKEWESNPPGTSDAPHRV